MSTSVSTCNFLSTKIFFFFFLFLYFLRTPNMRTFSCCSLPGQEIASLCLCLITLSFSPTERNGQRSGHCNDIIFANSIDIILTNSIEKLFAMNFYLYLALFLILLSAFIFIYLSLSLSLSIYIYIYIYIYIIKLLECTRCSKQYIGKSKWLFNFRINLDTEIILWIIANFSQ